MFGYVSEFCGRSDTWLILIPAVDVLMVDAMTIDVADPATLGSAVGTMIVVSLVLMVTGMIVDGMTGGTGMMTAVSPAMIVILVMIAVIVIIGRVTIGIRVVSVGIPMVMRVGAHRVVGIDGQRGDGHRQRRHSQRAGSGRNEGQRRSGPSRPNFREERTAKRMKEPSLPQDITSRDLDPSILQDLRSLSKDNAEQVGRHMVMAATLMQDDPQLALQHARAAKERAGRVAVVRETCGIAAYHAGEWKEALAELRAARRMSGGPGLMAVMADCERGLGHPEKAIEIARSEELSRLDAASMVELAIVVAGARQDMGQFDAAVAELERQDLNPSRHGVSASRLFYAYADALAAAGRTAEARQWFEHAADADEDELLDAADRLHELEG